MTSINNPVGSVWHRWDPHIHIPGTLKNDYKNGTTLEDFLQEINTSSPPIKALGITDYYVLDSYERILPIFKNGGLPNVELMFPNIELRFSVNAGKGSPINVHLLVSPDDEDHIEETKRFLRNLKFEYDGEDYGCVNDDLIRLGKAFVGNSNDKAYLLRAGVEQFKVSPNDLSKAFKNHQWARENIMVGVAAGQNDGTAQLQESGLTALREELQRMSHFVFSGRMGDREYWCGRGADSAEEIKRKYKSLKPCLHGSDAHNLESVGNPHLDRYCWLRGDLKFETLRQICFEPERRVFIGKEVSEDGFPSHTIDKVSVKDASWLKNPEISVNSGLVAIIGARGSGKTALVEMIAAGSGSVDQSHTKRSFLERARVLLKGTTSTVTWGNSETTTFCVDISQLPMESEEPRVRYLSQQFVDHLCSSDGLADELVNAIENVIFDAHSVDERLGARTFKELRSTKTESIKRSIEKYQKLLLDIGDNISTQDDLARNVEDLKKKRANEFAAIERMKLDRKKLIPSDNKELLKKLDQVREATEAKSQNIATIEKKELKLNGLKEEVGQFEDGIAKPYLEDLKANYEEAKLTEEQWSNFNLTYEGNVGILLQEELSETSKQLKNLKGPNIGEQIESKDKVNAKPYLQSYNNLSSNTYTLLLKEQNRLEALIGVDSARRKKYTELSNKIAKAETALKVRDKEVQNAEVAPSKIEELLAQRKNTYELLIGQIEKEEDLLSQLYSPLQNRLNSQKGTLSKLTFSVNRIVNIEQWAESGERLIDRSRVGSFRGVGTLTGIIKEALEHVWKNGSSKEIAKAMSEFRTEYGQAFWNHAFEDARKTRETKKHWYGQISSWLYGIDHVKVNYGLKYEGVDVQQLSPGTRGIVLLLLYLSIDIDDDRPLIIDQPEENLDPKSIFEELVEKFKEAKKRRQIIIVTHNANLVVNTDADQVIVASRGEHKKGALPDIGYMSGGLENPEIRKAVCDILEGGKQAFEERSKRLRISI
ncbi:putative AbiEii toxin of type IV toxin-antitoxin system [Flavobacteriaceae bacterium MAR_2009_75]|nr:putative AbiEii toxin of type IV toxin-antitoxin system [Flavobacteriaceae bacterium MAR_2009_75]